MSIYTKIIDLQKLGQAWQHVKKNKPAAGVDNITYDMFEKNKRAELVQLQIELQNHEYEALPVRQTVIFQGDKARTIALYCMRDKVVQQSVANELNKIFDCHFSDCVVAYRPNKSALAALEKVEDAIMTKKYQFALKLDIHHFFESIQWHILEAALREFIREDDVIALIKENSITRVLDESGAIEPYTSGIHMGSGIAPILSNIYLMKFDKWMTDYAQKMDACYLRYSDDILMLHYEKETLTNMLDSIGTFMEGLGLQLNDKKTICVSLQEGIDYLGHRFDCSGKSIPQKAKDDLQERLESMWLSEGLEFADKIKKADAIIGGWKQYFRGNRPCESTIELVVLVANSYEQENLIVRYAGIRKGLTNIYKDIAMFLADYWRKNGLFYMELLEYEQFYGVSDPCDSFNEALAQNPSWQEVLEEYRKLIISDSQESAVELMQLYTDLRRYETASFWQNYSRKTQTTGGSCTFIKGKDKGESGKELVFNLETAGKIMNALVGREDIYALETMVNPTKRGCETQLSPLTEKEIYKHLDGECTLATYIQRPNRTVKTIVVDIDVSKRILLQYGRETTEFKEYMKLALDQAYQVLKLYERLGLTGYIEYSGCRGYHVWLLFSEWIPLRYANMFCDLVSRSIEPKSDINMEYFPNKTAVRPGKYGQCLKIPFGLHVRTGDAACFLDSSGDYVQNINEFLDGLAFYKLSTIKKILAANTNMSEEDKIPQLLDVDLSAFGDPGPNISVVLNNCNLMKYLCGKAASTGYLSHFERLSVLYVFAHLGDSGKEFVHTVMSKTLNYQYSVTEKFIRKVPEKPISCLKLREQYKNISAEYGCNCSFKRSKNCYPSPVLHAIATSKDVTESITIPTSRSLTHEKEKKVLEELNIHTKAEELANKILGLKKQSRKLDASIRRIEMELSKLFDSEGIDCLEIEMGLLVRRKVEKGYEWVIEI